MQPAFRGARAAPTQDDAGDGYGALISEGIESPSDTTGRGDLPQREGGKSPLLPSTGACNMWAKVLGVAVLLVTIGVCSTALAAHLAADSSVGTATVDGDDPPFRVRTGPLLEATEHSPLPNPHDHGERSKVAIHHLDSSMEWRHSLNHGPAGARVTVAARPGATTHLSATCNGYNEPNVATLAESRPPLWSSSVSVQHYRVTPGQKNAGDECAVAVKVLDGDESTTDAGASVGALRRAGAVVIVRDGPADVFSHTHLLSYSSLVLGGGPVEIRGRILSKAAAASAPEGLSLSRASCVVWDHDSGKVVHAAEGAQSLDGDESALFSFEPPEEGDYYMQVDLETIIDGHTVRRTTHHVIPVVPRHISLPPDREAAAHVLDPDAETTGDNFHLTLRAECPGAILDPVKVYAQIWQGDSPVLWVRSMARPVRGGENSPECELTIRTSLEGGLHRAMFENGAYTLRDVRLQHRETSAVLSRATVLKLAVVPLSSDTMAFMRASPAPVMLVMNEAPSAPSLLLVHGYCASGDIWPPNDFEDFEVFRDFKEARSNDAFARRIAATARAYGMKDFGVVAHSQGGLASLHMMTFYDTGLHPTTGDGRPIQSVASPYQGTEVAGNVAAIGHVFGIGCGKVHDLTLDGAAQWLETIPPSDREQVYFYTVSFTSHGAWHWDYCDVVTDELLPDPDDGVVSVRYAQLPGGNGMGNTQGWCHTTGMEYPACYTDHERNALMNSLAQR